MTCYRGPVPIPGSGFRCLHSPRLLWRGSTWRVRSMPQKRYVVTIAIRLMSQFFTVSHNEDNQQASSAPRRHHQSTTTIISSKCPVKTIETQRCTKCTVGLTSRPKMPLFPTPGDTEACSIPQYRLEPMSPDRAGIRAMPSTHLPVFSRPNTMESELRGCCAGCFGQ
ncbi:hypothetical protein K438DRAFT_1747669 [Mycena galopus ATCC 62051]|nr:hypothetical protein K438DRAFT_1747669 [Mycena galopus ATCC 62051]